MSVELDELALSIVCIERVPMRLRGADRLAAIARLTARGVHQAEVARLLRTSSTMITRLRHLHHLDAAPVVESESWMRVCLYGAKARVPEPRPANGEMSDR